MFEKITENTTATVYWLTIGVGVVWLISLNLIAPFVAAAAGLISLVVATVVVIVVKVRRSHA